MVGRASACHRNCRHPNTDKIVQRRYLIAILATLSLFSGSVAAQTQGAKSIEVKANAPQVRYVGRTLVSPEGDVSFDWSGTYFTVRFTGEYFAMRVSDSRCSYYNVFLDGEPQPNVTTHGSDSVVIIVAGVGKRDNTVRAKGVVHTLRVQKRSEGEQGKTTIHSFSLAPKGELLPCKGVPLRHIEFIGNSLTCGYGTEGKSKDEPFKAETENCNLAYGAILSRFFDADYTFIAHSGRGAVRNYGDTLRESKVSMKDLMLRTFDHDPQAPLWDFTKSEYKPDIVVINLGSNDFSTKPHPTRMEFTVAYARILSQIRSAYGNIPVLCVAPRVNEPAFTYIRDFCDQAYDSNVHFAAILPGTYNAGSDLGSSAHPNYMGQRKMAMVLAPHISSIMGWDIPNKIME